ncbi:MAG TPA: thioredoxin-dependent thiol peroxidase [Polyangiaceae bacterium]
MAAKKSKAKPSTPTKASPSKAVKTNAQSAPRPSSSSANAKPALAAKAKPAPEPAAASVALAAGSKAPAFSLPDETGAVVSSTSLAGKPYVIYFYPKDDTPGCTKEACDFRDNLKAFNSAKVRVLGVSPDDPKRHAKFKEKYGLNFTLLSDVDKTLIGAYGIWIKKLNYGREYMGVQRSTFIIDKAGKVAKAWNGVRVPGHVEAVLAAL